MQLLPWFIAENVTANDVALCRNTKPLVEQAYEMFRNGVACRVEGRDIGEGLIQLATKWKTVKTTEQLRTKLAEYRTNEIQKWTDKKNAFKAQVVEDKCDTLEIIIDNVEQAGGRQIDSVVNQIRSMFGDTPDGTKAKVFTLSTIHKSKGREWNRVYILQRDLIPSKYAKQAWQLKQEQNLEYVAITRAKQELIYVG